MTAGIAAIVLFAGLAVGMTGIGGLLVVPALSVLGNMPLTQAVPASTLAFLFTGLAATAHLQWRARHAADARSPAPEPTLQRLTSLQLAALLGAGLGAFTLSALPTTGVHVALAILALLSGLQTLLRSAPSEDSAGRIGVAAQCAIGLAVGLGSAWSGTGGPILLLPVLMWLRTPTRNAIAMAQAIQLPIAVAATAVNFAFWQLDWRLGLTIGALLLVGWVAGIWVATRMPTRRLRQALGWLLVGIGVWYGVHILKA